MSTILTIQLVEGFVSTTPPRWRGIHVFVQGEPLKAPLCVSCSLNGYNRHKRGRCSYILQNLVFLLRKWQKRLPSFNAMRYRSLPHISHVGSFLLTPLMSSGPRNSRNTQGDPPVFFAIRITSHGVGKQTTSVQQWPQLWHLNRTVFRPMRAYDTDCAGKGK